jgi:hypothetical protein
LDIRDLGANAAFTLVSAPSKRGQKLSSITKYTPGRGRVEKLRQFNALDQRGQLDT